MEVGEKIAGRYRLLGRLASGGMGEVWAASNDLTNREFAIKFLLNEFATNDEAYNRFVREAETTGKLQHPSIVDVFDVAQMQDGRPFIVMELLQGEGLDKRLEREGTVPQLQVAAYFAQISMGLDLAHRAGVIHRDLSSSNIYLARSRETQGIVPKILDFGVSKHLGPNAGDFKTCHGAVLGNPLYMSPEQARGAEQVDPRTDVWSLGVLMYQCLTGVAAFSSRNYNALMVDIMTRPHRPLLELAPAADRALAAIVESCLVKDREGRIGSASELAERLGEAARRLGLVEGLRPLSPRRRATDRLPQARKAKRGQTWLPGLEASAFSSGIGYGRVAVFSGLLGAGVGAMAMYMAVGSSEPVVQRPSVSVGTSAVGIGAIDTGAVGDVQAASRSQTASARVLREAEVAQQAPESVVTASRRNSHSD